MSAQATLPRAVARSRRIDLRVVVGLLLFLAGILATSGIIRQANERSTVLVAAANLEAGHALQPGDLQVAEIGLGAGVASIDADELDALSGRVLAGPVESGQILSPSTIAAGPPLDADEVAISVAVPPAHAVGGTLQSGNRVAVLATREPERALARTTVLLSGVRVIAVLHPEGAGADPSLTVTLAVSTDDAAAIAQAANSGVIDLVLLPGGPE